MSGFVDIELAMQHLRANDADKEYVRALLAAAEESAALLLGRKVFADQEDLDDAAEDGTAGDYPIVATPMIVAACLLALGHLYANREDVVTGTISTLLPVNSQTLLQPYRVGMGV